MIRRSTHLSSAAAAFILLMLSAPTSARAQRIVESTPQYWHLAFVQGPIHGPWLYYLEAQPRIGTSDSRLLLRSAMGLGLHPKVSLWLGFGWIPTWPYDAPAPQLNESRLYQQLNWSPTSGAIRWLSRTRLEQRALSGTRHLAHRLRTLLRASLPLGTDGPLSLILWDEVFFHLNSIDVGPRAGFDQNRAFAGAGLKLSPHVTFEFGYLNNFIRRPAAETDRMVHALYTFTVFNFL